MKASQNGQKNILLVGDWVVDEHWVASAHRSETASRKGKLHFRSMHRPESAVQSLSGAGKVASLLCCEQLGDQPAFHIECIGAWHPNDKGALLNLLTPSNATGATPFRLTPAVTNENDQPKNCILHNLFDQDLGKDLPQPDWCMTNHIIRLYQQAGGKVQFLQRLDWEMQVPKDSDGYPDLLLNNEGKANPAMQKRLKMVLNNVSKSSKKFDAVVIKDLRKGMITKEVIKQLINAPCCKGARWFVSSKCWQPKWLDELKQTNLELCLVPQGAAQNAIRNALPNSSLNRWLTRTGIPTMEALETIRKLQESLRSTRKPNHPTVIVMPEEMSIIAKGGADGSQGLVQRDSITGKRRDVQSLYLASIFFPLIVSEILRDGSLASSPHLQVPKHIKANAPSPNDAFQQLLETSLAMTQRAIDDETKRVLEPDTWKPGNAASWKQARGQINSSCVRCGTWSSINWKADEAAWAKATSNFGFIEVNSSGLAQPEANTYKLELWRAATDLDGYICLAPNKRKMLRIISDLVRDFASPSGESRRHVSCLFSSPPGFGKSYIVRTLAKQFDLPFLSFNITQMHTRHDLFDSFDTISAAQTEAHDRPLMIFFDEINALVDGDPVYGAFLGPLDDGNYIRNGKTVHLDPCVWIFAGTRYLSASNTTHSQEDSEKQSDFLSRLSTWPLSLEIPDDEETIGRVERVYIGAQLIVRLFPDVRYVETGVLEIFHQLPLSLGIRPIERFIRSLNFVQDGIVRGVNVSNDGLEYLRRQAKFDVDDWTNTKRSRRELVKIETKP